MPKNKSKSKSKARPVDLKNLLAAYREAVARGDENWPPKNLLTRHQYCNALIYQYGTFSSLMSQVQLERKLGLNDPATTLKGAIDRAEVAAKFWLKGNKIKGPALSEVATPYDLPERLDGVYYRFGSAAVISLLVRNTMSKAILAAVPKTSSFKDQDIRTEFHYFNFPDAGLVELLQTGKRPRNWTAILSHSIRRFGYSRLRDSYEGYTDFILACYAERWSEAIEHVHRCEDLYAQRRLIMNAFESWEVPIPETVGSFDLRMSALIRYCFRNKKALAELDTIHRWS